MQKLNRHPLPLSLGEVSERSEDGEGKLGCKALSVTFGDSSPRGRAKGLCPHVGLKNGTNLHGYAPLTLRPPIKSVGQFPSGSAYGAEGCQLVYISFVSLRQAEASSRRVLHDTMGQMDAMV